MVQRTKLTVTALLAVLVLLTCATNSFGFGQGNEKVTKLTPDGFPEKGITNLIKGVESDNEGLKKSSIYYAGVYEIKEMVTPLIKQLSNEKDADTKILIALALYRIGDEAGLKAIQEFMENDENKVVRVMAKSILKQLSENDKGSYSVTKN